MTLPSQEHHYVDFCHYRYVLSVLGYLINGFIQYVLFCVWLLSFHIMSPRFIPVVEASSSFLENITILLSPFPHKLLF